MLNAGSRLGSWGRSAPWWMQGTQDPENARGGDRLQNQKREHRAKWAGPGLACGTRERERVRSRLQRPVTMTHTRHAPKAKTTAPAGVCHTEQGPRPPALPSPEGRPHPPDLDGGAVENLPVTVPGAVGGGAAAGAVLAGGLAQPLLPWLAEGPVLVLPVLRHKLELLGAVNFNKSEVELAGEGRGCSQR